MTNEHRERTVTQTESHDSQTESDNQLPSQIADGSCAPPTHPVAIGRGRGKEGFLPQAQMGESSASLARVRQYTILHPNPTEPQAVRRHLPSGFAFSRAACTPGWKGGGLVRR